MDLNSISFYKIEFANIDKQSFPDRWQLQSNNLPRGQWIKRWIKSIKNWELKHTIIALQSYIGCNKTKTFMQQSCEATFEPIRFTINAVSNQAVVDTRHCPHSFH
eukprot:441226_1